jgi:hypothetical protein
LNGTTVNGQIIVQAGSGLTAGIDLDTFSLTHDPSTIDGRVTFDEGGFFLADATLRSGIAKRGAFNWHSVCGDDPFCFGVDVLCHSDVRGNLAITDVSTEQVYIGDPGEQGFANGDCAGNTIHGSISMDDTNFVRFDGETSEIEGNAVTGSVHLDHTTAEVNENTIGGSLLCTQGTVIHPPAPYDIPGNTVPGQDTCD